MTEEELLFSTAESEASTQMAEGMQKIHGHLIVESETLCRSIKSSRRTSQWLDLVRLIARNIYAYRNLMQADPDHPEKTKVVVSQADRI